MTQVRRDGAGRTKRHMGAAVGQMLPYAVGVMVSPMPVVAMVLMLVTPQARANGIAFVLGWILGIALGGDDPSAPRGA